jgi:hypothetical protein
MISVVMAQDRAGLIVFRHAMSSRNMLRMHARMCLYAFDLILGNFGVIGRCRSAPRLGIGAMVLGFIERASLSVALAID